MNHLANATEFDVTLSTRAFRKNRESKMRKSFMKVCLPCEISYVAFSKPVHRFYNCCTVEKFSRRLPSPCEISLMHFTFSCL